MKVIRTFILSKNGHLFVVLRISIIALARQWETKIHPKRAVRLMRVLSMRSFVCITELEHSWKCYHIHIHSTNAPFTHSIWRLPTQITPREWIIRSSHKRRRFAGVAQLFRRHLCARLCEWKLCILSISSAGSKILWVTYLLYSRLIVSILRIYSSTSDLSPHTRKRIEL